MKLLSYITVLASLFIFTSCSSLSGAKSCSKTKTHSCCSDEKSVCKTEGCKEDKSCCEDKCGKCDGKSSCKDGSCDLPKRA